MLSVLVLVWSRRWAFTRMAWCGTLCWSAMLVLSRMSLCWVSSPPRLSLWWCCCAASPVLHRALLETWIGESEGIPLWSWKIAAVWYIYLYDFDSIPLFLCKLTIKGVTTTEKFLGTSFFVCIACTSVLRFNIFPCIHGWSSITIPCF